jgi:hypothetical protein
MTRPEQIANIARLCRYADNGPRDEGRPISNAGLELDENVWLTQKRMAELFGCTADNISLHLKNIYKEKELDEMATTEDFSVVQQEGSRNVARKITGLLQAPDELFCSSFSPRHTFF